MKQGIGALILLWAIGCTIGGLQSHLTGKPIDPRTVAFWPGVVVSGMANSLKDELTRQPKFYDEGDHWRDDPYGYGRKPYRTYYYVENP